MGKGKFIAGTILGALSVACGIVSMMSLYHLSQISKANGGSVSLMGGVMVVLFLIIPYTAAHFALGIGAEIFLWINFKNNGFAKKASMIIAIVCAAVMTICAGYIVVMQIADSEKTQAAVYLITNFVKT